MKIKIENKQENTPVNIFKKGNIVQHKDGTIIFVTKDSLSEIIYFSGFAINNPYKNSDLIIGDRWLKKEFTLLEGKMILENDLDN